MTEHAVQPALSALSEIPGNKAGTLAMQKFVEAFSEYGDPEKAALSAGYAASCARSYGYHLAEHLADQIEKNVKAKVRFLPIKALRLLEHMVEHDKTETGIPYPPTVRRAAASDLLDRCGYLNRAGEAPPAQPAKPRTIAEIAAELRNAIQAAGVSAEEAGSLVAKIAGTTPAALAEPIAVPSQPVVEEAQVGRPKKHSDGA